MNQGGHQTWSSAPPSAEEDFSQFLDFNDVDVGIPHENVDNCSRTQPDAMELGAGEYVQDLNHSQLSTPMTTAYPSGDSLADMALQQIIQQQTFQQQTFQQQMHQQAQSNSTHLNHRVHKVQLPYLRQGVVPLTPNTIEMHGQQDHAFTDPQALGMYETSKHQDQMVFTPLVSPAFQLQDYGTPSEYFSPLTSPALHAQDRARASAHNAFSADNERRDVGVTASAARRSKRRATAGTKDPVHAVRSSPAMKVQQKRHSGGGKTPKEIAEIIAGLGALHQGSPSLAAHGRDMVPRSQGNSDTGSISPEPLSEVLMPPPALPRSGSQGKSAQSSPQDTKIPNTGGSCPATPASLFRIQKPRDAAIPNKDGSTEVRLYPVNSSVGDPSNPSMPSIASGDAIECSITPTLKPRSTNSAPASAVLTSPRSGELGPDSISLSSPPAKDTGTQGRMNKRSTSSHVSPALLPRISPSIKPLLPGGANLNTETTALLLANKSNYERIIDGSASSLGVNFPAQLSENLTSKRTSHKLAEQGRRNRINTALAEIHTLLPDSFGKEPNDNSGGGSTGASKAKTVENAIEYIRMLQEELKSTRSKLAETEQVLRKTENRIREAGMQRHFAE